MGVGRGGGLLERLQCPDEKYQSNLIYVPVCNELVPVVRRF